MIIIISEFKVIESNSNFEANMEVVNTFGMNTKDHLNVLSVGISSLFLSVALVVENG